MRVSRSTAISSYRSSVIQPNYKGPVDMAGPFFLDSDTDSDSDTEQAHIRTPGLGCGFGTEF